MKSSNKRTGTINRTTTKRLREYLVKWKGYVDPTWEPESNIQNCRSLIHDFNNQHRSATANMTIIQENRASALVTDPNMVYDEQI